MMIIPYYQTDRFTLYNGDCLAIMAQLEANSVDALVTDPPAGISFMGKEWDHHKGGRDAWVTWLTEVMRECLRVLKPGGHALVWALPRTSHWTAWAIESAGFEIRDRVSHLFGSGFPKSLDVSRAIDGYLGVERNEGVEGPFTARRPQERVETNIGGFSGTLGGKASALITQPATWAARQWEGFGTALKPACEDWWLCRKPLDGTIAENVLKHGTGGLNIAACRIGTDAVGWQGDPSNGFSGGLDSRQEGGRPVIGRWPSHVTHDGSDEVLAGFPNVGVSSGGGMKDLSGGLFQGNTNPNITQSCGFGDSGSAARFFYCSKADKRDREEGLGDLPLHSPGEVTDRQDGSDGLNSPRAGAGRTSGARNAHPTVKSTELMRWLCRLITPPLGIVLDPFCGSGSTGKAAMIEGFRFIGIEASPEYCEIAQRRIEVVTLQPGLFTPEQLAGERQVESEPLGQEGLFTY